MSIKYLLKEFKLPKEITLKTIENENTMVFEVEPLERGFATSIGNLYRRVLLSSIQGYAVSAIRIHIGQKYLTSEYDSIPGLVEDSISIIDKIKILKFVIDQESKDSLQKLITAEFKGKGVCKAEILERPDVIILNKDLVLFEATEDVDITLELEVELGRGYVPSEITEKRIEDEQTISIDAVFSPIENVFFTVENIRIGHRSDYEKLLLTVKTDDTISAIDAIAQAAKIIKEHMNIFISFNEDEVEVLSEDETKLLEMKKLLQLSIDELELSSRSYNCLRTANIMNIGALVQLTEKDIQALPNFGSKSMDEIQSKLSELNFSLGMPLPPEVLN